MPDVQTNTDLQTCQSLQITSIHETDKMSSLQIAEITKKRHDAILRDIRNLLQQGVAVHNFVESSYEDANQRNRPCYYLTKKGCLILASGYDAKLREKIIDRWEELEIEKRATKPLSQLDILAQSVQILQEQEKRLTEVEDRVKVIEAKQTTHQNWFTIAGYGTLHKIQVGIKLAASLGRKATNLCRQKGVEPEEIPDPRFGKVKTYPEDVLKQVFEMPIN